MPSEPTQVRRFFYRCRICEDTWTMLFRGGSMVPGSCCGVHHWAHKSELEDAPVEQVVERYLEGALF